MANYLATINWQRDTNQNKQDFTNNKYSRAHQWHFDGGVSVPASSSPHVVPLPYSVEQNVDPEEALVASLSSCHMLFFLSIAAKRKYIVDSYIDEAIGTMGKNEHGKMAFTEVVLHPQIVFSGEKQPTQEQVDKIHHMAHEQCFIANSVNFEVRVETIL